MYKIMKNGKRFNTKTYGSYEEARKYAIKKVRASVGGTFYGARGVVLNYPTLSDLGFSIKRIA